MKTSFKILISTIVFTFIMIFAQYFNIKVEINKYVTGEINFKQNNLGNFNNIVINTKADISFYNSKENIIYGEVDLTNYRINNDTLYINDTTKNVKIDFVNIKSIELNNGCYIFIDSLFTKKLKINNNKKSHIEINKGIIENLLIYSDSSDTYIKQNCNITNITGKLLNNSYLSTYSRIKYIKFDTDTSSTLYINNYRRY